LDKRIWPWYKSGIEVEFGITSAEWAEIPVDSGTFRIVFDGSKILVDKSKKLKQLLSEVKKSKVKIGQNYLI